VVCLAVPGKICAIDETGPLRTARVQFGAIFREVSLQLVPDARIGDFVMVHVGIAIGRVDAAEAQRTFQLLEQIGAVEQEVGSLAE
jgi:hydrogenase expression/formation protein HypC